MQAETRLHLSNGAYVSINQILKAHINDHAFNELVLSNAVVDARASKQDSLVKEQIKGALKTSGLSGERKVRTCESRRISQVTLSRSGDFRSRD